MPLPKQENNPFWPLPSDYGELGANAQRKARVALCQSWWSFDDPKKVIVDPEAFIVAFQFFKEYYRKGWQGNQPKYTLKTPDLHNHWIRLAAYNTKLIITSFRRSGKTFLFGEEIPEFMLVTRPHTAIMYTSAAEDLTVKQIRAVRLGIEQNPKIREDFGALQGKKPLLWKTEYIELTNGSSFIGLSADQRMRGTTQRSLRPLVQILDDPEFDQRVRNPQLVANFGNFLFDVFFPCAEPWAIRWWTNTLLSVKCWAMKAANKEDSRFTHWHAARYDIVGKDDDGNLVSNWPDLFPVEDIKLMMGDGSKNVVGYGAASFSQEFMNNPIMKHGAAFDFSPSRHGYEWDIKHGRKILRLPAIADEPQTIVDYEDLESRSIAVMGVDLSLGLADGDFSGLVVGRLDDRGVFWILDVLNIKGRPIDVLHESLRLGERWNVQVIGVERITFEQVAIDAIEEEVNTRRSMNMYCPDFLPIKRGGGPSKGKHILSLQFRFSDQKIRIPIADKLHIMSDPTVIPEFIDQINFFSVEGEPLRYDDLLDAMVHAQDTLKHIGRQIDMGTGTPTENNILKLMKQAVKDGVSPWMGLDNYNKMQAHMPPRVLTEEAEKRNEKPDEDFAISNLSIDGMDLTDLYDGEL